LASPAEVKAPQTGKTGPLAGRPAMEAFASIIMLGIIMLGKSHRHDAKRRNNQGEMPCFNRL
jgi:hypothetical protein